METIFLLTVLFVAVSVHAALGFGTALIAMPVAVFLLGLPVAAPLVALVMTATILMTLSDYWRHIDFPAAGQLIGFSVLGMPLGILLVRDVDMAWGQAGLGVVLVIFSIYRLTNATLQIRDHLAWRLVAGLLAGCFGAAYNNNAPPIVVYGSLVRWQPDQFRGTLQGFFLPSSLLICLSHASSGLWTAEVGSLFLISLPVIVAAFFVGRRLSKQMSSDGFENAVYVISGVMGLALIVRVFLV